MPKKKLKELCCGKLLCRECPLRVLICSAHYTYTLEEVLKATYKKTLKDKYSMPKEVYEAYMKSLEKEVEVYE